MTFSKVDDPPLPFEEDEEEPVRYCEAETFRGTYYDPPEFCEEEALPGSDYCEGHDPDVAEGRAAERAEAMREERYV